MSFLPQHIEEALKRYVQQRIPTGDFLRAVLENNLSEACGRADVISMANLHSIVAYIYNDLPCTCWGSKEKVAAWLTEDTDTDTDKENTNDEK